jgi:hypothetical protein
VRNRRNSQAVGLLKGGWWVVLANFVTVASTGKRYVRHTGHQTACLDLGKGIRTWTSAMAGRPLRAATTKAVAKPPQSTKEAPAAKAPAGASGPSNTCGCYTKSVSSYVGRRMGVLYGQTVVNSCCRKCYCSSALDQGGEQSDRGSKQSVYGQTVCQDLGNAQHVPEWRRKSQTRVPQTPPSSQYPPTARNPRTCSGTSAGFAGLLMWCFVLEAFLRL